MVDELVGQLEADRDADQHRDARLLRQQQPHGLQALESAEWFGSAHRAQVMEATGQEDTMARLEAVQRLIAEETRVSMLVGVAVGYELAHVLNEQRGDD